MKAFLAVAVILALALSTEAFFSSLTIRDYNLIPDREVTSKWITRASYDFDIRYHLVHRDEKPSFRFELRGKYGKPIKEVTGDTRLGILDYDEYGWIGDYYGLHKYTKDNQFTSPWYEIPDLTRKDILQHYAQWSCGEPVVRVVHSFAYTAKMENGAIKTGGFSDPIVTEPYLKFNSFFDYESIY